MNTVSVLILKLPSSQLQFLHSIVKLGKYHTISADDKANASVYTSRYRSIAKAK